jgi:hypothetical protein
MSHFDPGEGGVKSGSRLVKNIGILYFALKICAREKFDRGKFNRGRINNYIVSSEAVPRCSLLFLTV